jgi:hypothetical protein
MPQPAITVEQLDATAGAATLKGTLSAVAPLDFGLVDGAESAVFCVRLSVADGKWNGSAGFTAPTVWVENAEIPGHAVRIGFSDAWAQNGQGVAFSKAPASPLSAVAAPVSWALAPGGNGEGATSGFLWLKVTRGTDIYPDTTFGGVKGRLRLHIEGGE